MQRGGAGAGLPPGLRVSAALSLQASFPMAWARVDGGGT